MCVVRGCADLELRHVLLGQVLDAEAHVTQDTRVVQPTALPTTSHQHDQREALLGGHGCFGWIYQVCVCGCCVTDLLEVLWVWGAPLLDGLLPDAVLAHLRHPAITHTDKPRSVAQQAFSMGVCFKYGLADRCVCVLPFLTRAPWSHPRTRPVDRPLRWSSAHAIGQNKSTGLLTAYVKYI